MNKKPVYLLDQNGNYIETAYLDSKPSLGDHIYTDQLYTVCVTPVIFESINVPDYITVIVKPTCADIAQLYQSAIEMIQKCL